MKNGLIYFIIILITIISVSAVYIYGLNSGCADSGDDCSGNKPCCTKTDSCQSNVCKPVPTPSGATCGDTTCTADQQCVNDKCQDISCDVEGCKKRLAAAIFPCVPDETGTRTNPDCDIPASMGGGRGYSGSTGQIENFYNYSSWDGGTDSYIIWPECKYCMPRDTVAGSYQSLVVTNGVVDDDNITSYVNHYYDIKTPSAGIDVTLSPYTGKDNHQVVTSPGFEVWLGLPLWIDDNAKSTILTGLQDIL